MRRFVTASSSPIHGRVACRAGRRARVGAHRVWSGHTRTVRGARRSMTSTIQWIPRRWLTLWSCTCRETRSGGHTYVSLAHNERDEVDGVSRARILYNSGRKDRLELGAVRRLITSLNRCLPSDEVTPAVAVSGDGVVWGAVVHCTVNKSIAQRGPVPPVAQAERRVTKVESLR
jgi:hypothetical protein